jgi:hypothetical protein
MTDQRLTWNDAPRGYAPANRSAHSTSKGNHMAAFGVSNFNIQVNAQANPEAAWEMAIVLNLQESDPESPSTGVASLNFYPDASTLPDNTWAVEDKKGTYSANFHTSQFANVLAVLRSSKDVGFYFDENSLSATINTGNENVGN